MRLHQFLAFGICVAGSLLADAALGADDGMLKVVGVLGNTSGMSARPVPYAYYSGIGLDARGRLYLAGAAEGIVVCDQDGRCLAILPVPQADGMAVQSLVARAGDALFFVANHPTQRRAALYRVETKAEEPGKLTVERIGNGAGHWAISPTLDAQGKVIIGQSDVAKLKYTAAAFDPVTVQATTLLTLDEPKGAMNPGVHTIQVEPDGALSIQHNGGVNWSRRYNLKGEKTGDALPGLVVDQYRYQLGWAGQLRRMDLANEQPAPGDCGYPAPEIRMARQLVRSGERYFFAGRGGALEARWNGTNFIYTRRIGAVFLQDMLSTDGDLRGVAFTDNRTVDVEHIIEIPKNQPIGQLLKVTTPLYGKWVSAIAPAPEGFVIVYTGQKGTMVGYVGQTKQLEFDLPIPQVKEVGQAAVAGKDLLLADPKSGVIWRRPLLDKTTPLTPMRGDLPGVTGLAITPDALFVGTATTVSCLSPDAQKVLWTCSEAYKGVRRLAATSDHVYVCDTAGNVVDQLNAKTGRRLARLGTMGEPGSDLSHLNAPCAIAADPTAVYVADNGNGRVLVATTTLWRPQITALPREDTSPITAVKIPVAPPQAGRMSVNIYDQNDVTVRQLACAQPSDQPVIWDGRDMYGQWAKPGTYRYHGLIAPKFSLRYVTSISQSGTPPYRTADGKGSWGGVWGYVMGICPVSAEPDADIIVLWAFEEGEGGLIRMSQDGEVRWKQHLDWWMKASQMAVACDGPFVYIAALSAMNAPGGQDKYSGELNRPLLWRVDAATGQRKPFEGTDQQNQRMFGEYLKGGRIVTGIAVRQGKVYLTAPAQNKLFVADSAGGKELAAWSIENVSGVTFDAQGQLLAGSGSKIVAIDGQGKIVRTIADAGGETWDVKATSDGRIVATVGAPRHQIVWFDAQGKELRAWGRSGGRPLCGKMLPESFLNPVGLCITGNGKVFVAENATPKRFTRWSADGALEREFDGPQYYSGMFGVDDEQPQFVYGDTHGDIIRYIVDYNTGKWQIDRYWIGAYKESGVPTKWWPRIRHRDGKTYWCSGSGGIVELLDDRVRGVAAVYGGWLEKLPDGNYRPATRNTGLKGAWSDLNGDGKPQPEEWRVTDKPVYPITVGGPQQGWGCYFDQNFDLYMHDWSDNEAGGVWKIPVVEWKNGTPVYRWDRAQCVGQPRGHGLLHGANGTRTTFAQDGAVYGFNGGYNSLGLPGVGHGHDWEFAQITKYDGKTGQPLWHAGERTAGFAAPGQHYCPTGPAGIIGDYLFWTDENSLVHAWDTQHGLYVDTLLNDTMRGPTPSAYTVWVELFNTRIFRHPTTGKIYLMAASDAIHIYEVMGTEQKPVRFEGQFQLTQAGVDAAQKQVASRTVAQERTLSIKRAPAAVTVDGDLSEFASAPVAEIVLRQTAQGTARLMYDDKYLYVGFDVKDDSPWKNASGDISTLFKTGDTADLWLGPSNAKRVPGLKDVRVMFAPSGGKNIAVAFRPKVEKDAKRVPFRSPRRGSVDGQGGSPPRCQTRREDDGRWLHARSRHPARPDRSGRPARPHRP